MKTTAIILTLLILTATATPPTPKQAKALLRCRHNLSLARKELKCALLRLSLPKRIKAARKCRFNGLTVPQYRKLRDVCRTREATVLQLKEMRKKCVVKGKCDLGKLKKMRRKAVKACERIGLGKTCEDVAALRKKLGEVVGSACGEGGVEEKRMAVERIGKRCARLGGVEPKPSNVVRA